jgi:hypothetical protein
MIVTIILIAMRITIIIVAIIHLNTFIELVS